MANFHKKNLVLTLERTFLSLGSSFCHFIVPHPSVIFQAHVGKAFPFPSSEDATEATATEARGCKVESSSSSLQAAAASPSGHSITTWTKKGGGGYSKVYGGHVTNGELIYTCKMIQPGVFSRFSLPVNFFQVVT